MLNIAGLRLPMIGDHIVTGDVYFVDSGATGTSDSNDGLRPDRGRVLATWDGANNKCTASNGDFIILMPGHTESTSAIALDTAGVTTIGIGHGADIPTITSTATAADLVDISAASAWIENVKLVGNTSCTALIDFATTADNCTLKNCVFSSGAAPVDQITVAATCNYGTIDSCQFIGTAAGLANCVLFETNVTGVSNDTTNWMVLNCLFDATNSAGCDDACIMISISSGGVTGILIKDCTFLGLADGDAAVNGAGVSSGLSSGMVLRANAEALDPTDSFVATTGVGWVDCHSVSIGTHSYDGMAGASRHPRLTPTP